jgi:DNA-binding SARP family transcriptional activator
MDYRILGSLEVWDGERQLDLGGTKRRALLALLLLHANEVVATDQLVDALWGEKAPGNAAGALHTHISRLRKELGPDAVATRAWGYVLRVEPGALDLERFERMSLEAESLPAVERAKKLRETLVLWRGRPLEDLAFEPSLDADIARLEELRLTVLENRIDADLEAGHANGIVGELEALIAAHPLRERLRGQLILALYRDGRQAEALEVYRETRRVLADELGLDPSPALRELERAILQQDPALGTTPIRTDVLAEPDVRPGRRRRLYIAASLTVLLLAGLGAAAGYGLSARPTHAARGQTTSGPANEGNIHVLAWKSLERATKGVMHSFYNLTSRGRPPGIQPTSVPSEARRVPLIDGGTVWVTQATNGGLCFEFAKVSGCDPSPTHAIDESIGATAPTKCGATWTLTRVSGLVYAKGGSTLGLEFSDGTVIPMKPTWVGPPINAGFFEDESIPAGKHATALVLRQPSGAILAKETEGFALLDRGPCPAGTHNAKSHNQ